MTKPKPFNTAVKLFALNGMVFDLKKTPGAIHIFGHASNFEFYPSRCSLRDLDNNHMQRFQNVEEMIHAMGHEFARSKAWRRDELNAKYSDAQIKINKLQKDLQKKKEECSITHDKSERVTRFFTASVIINIFLVVHLLMGK